MVSGRELISVPTPCAVSQLRNYFKHCPMCISASPISSANLWCFRLSFDSAQMQSNKIHNLALWNFCSQVHCYQSLTREQASQHQPALLLLACVSVVISYIFCKLFTGPFSFPPLFVLFFPQTDSLFELLQLFLRMNSINVASIQQCQSYSYFAGVGGCSCDQQLALVVEEKSL